VHKPAVLHLRQRRVRLAEVRVPEVVDKLAVAAVEAPRRCTPLHPVRRT